MSPAFKVVKLCRIAYADRAAGRFAPSSGERLLGIFRTDDAGTVTLSAQTPVETTSTLSLVPTFETSPPILVI
jgi:hypothetical protein